MTFGHPGRNRFEPLWVDIEPLVFKECRCSNKNVGPVDLASDTLPRDRLQAHDRLQFHLLLVGRQAHGHADRVSRCNFD